MIHVPKRTRLHLIPILFLGLGACRSAGDQTADAEQDPITTAYMCELAFRNAADQGTYGNPTDLITVVYEVVDHGDVPGGVGYNSSPVADGTYMRLGFSFSGSVHGGLASSSSDTGVQFSGASAFDVYLEVLPSTGGARRFHAFVPGPGSYQAVEIPFRVQQASPALGRPARRIKGENSQKNRYEGVIEIELGGLSGQLIHFG